jgi:hypothetical protein
MFDLITKTFTHKDITFQLSPRQELDKMPYLIKAWDELNRANELKTGEPR